MKKLLVDSDIVIDYLRGLVDAHNFLDEGPEIFDLYLSVVTLVEIYSGKDTLQAARVKEAEQLVLNFELAFITPAVARRAGSLRRDYKGQFADMLIAATALEYGFILATRNTKHFQSLPGLKLKKPY